MRRWTLVLSNLLTATVVLALGSVAIGAAPTLVTIIQGGLALSVSNPLPISGSISATNPSVGTNGAAAPTSSTLGGVSDGTNLQQLIAPLDLGDGVNGNNMVSMGGWVWNGATWDRMRGSTSGISTNPTVKTTGGVSTTYVVEPTASDNHAVIKAGAGQVYFVSAFNNSATVNYFRFYNATTGFNGCNSATNLVYEGMIPASTSGAGVSIPLPMPLAFATGISICVTGAYGNTSTTNATASAISLNVGYN